MLNELPDLVELSLINGDLIESRRIPKFLTSKTGSYIKYVPTTTSISITNLPVEAILKYLENQKRIAEENRAPQGEIELLTDIIEWITEGKWEK